MTFNRWEPTRKFLRFWENFHASGFFFCSLMKKKKEQTVYALTYFLQMHVEPVSLPSEFLTLTTGRSLFLLRSFPECTWAPSSQTSTHTRSRRPLSWGCDLLLVSGLTCSLLPVCPHSVALCRAATWPAVNRRCPGGCVNVPTRRSCCIMLLTGDARYGFFFLTFCSKWQIGY